MKNLYQPILFIITIALLSSCATMGGTSSNDYFSVEKETIIDNTKEALRDNNLRIHEEVENEDGSYEITAYQPEGRKFTSQESAINRIRVLLTPQEENGFRVSVQQPRKHAMARTASSVDYRSRILRSLNELLPPDGVAEL